MGVLFGIAISVVHPVKDCISPRIQKRRALRNKGKSVEKTLPKLIHPKHLMRGIAVQKKRL